MKYFILFQLPGIKPLYPSLVKPWKRLAVLILSSFVEESYLPQITNFYTQMELQLFSVQVCLNHRFPIINDLGMSSICLCRILNICFVSFVSHKKSYLVCVELTNWRIFTQPIPNFFFKVQNWDSQQRAETAAVSNFKISSNLKVPNWLMICQKH